MKKLMCLGGNYYQMTAVKAAKRLGYYVIDVDYLPENPAHEFADEYHNISTLDKDAVLDLATKLDIDGIISYASDVSAPTAAYVAEKLGLPTNPSESVEILTHKDQFRKFLLDHNFRVPQSSIIHNYDQALDFLEKVKKPIMIKPIDSSGSKGVSKVDGIDKLEEAIEEARKYTRSEILLAEEFIQRVGYQVAGDAFLVDGEIRYFGLANEHFDRNCNPFVPIGESFPANISNEMRYKALNEIQRVMTLLNMKNGAINLDFMFDSDGEVIILELGPRNGGNLISDAILFSCGVDLAEYTVKAAVGDDISDLKETINNKYIASYILHSTQNGIFDEITFEDKIKVKILRNDLFIHKGQSVTRFNNAGFGIGAMLISFDSMEQMTYMMDHMDEFIHIKLL